MNIAAMRVRVTFQKNTVIVDNTETTKPAGRIISPAGRLSARAPVPNLPV